MENDLDLKARILKGDTAAVEEFVAIQKPMLERFVSSLDSSACGASQVFSIAADIITDCCSGENPLISKFSGTGDGGLGSWLRTVARYRFYNMMRSPALKKRSGSETAVEQAADDSDAFAEESELAAVEALRGAVAYANRVVGEASPTGIVLLRLIHLHGIPGGVLASLWGKHAAQVTRRVSDTMERFRDEVLASLQSWDPLFAMSWADCAALCRKHPRLLHGD
jgi:DNA-directed RNA polymerase specialized sigma24 family protein